MRIDLDSRVMVTKFVVKSPKDNMYLKSFKAEKDDCIATVWTGDLDQAQLFDSVEDAPKGCRVVPVMILED